MIIFETLHKYICSCRLTQFEAEAPASSREESRILLTIRTGGREERALGFRCSIGSTSEYGWVVDESFQTARFRR